MFWAEWPGPVDFNGKSVVRWNQSELSVSLWIAYTTILAIHYVKVYIFTSAVFWAQWPAPVDFREESQLPVVPLHTGSSSANMNCLRVLILPPPTSAVGFYRPIASQPQVITRAREVRATQGGSYTTTHRAGPWFLGRSPPLQTVIFSPAFAGPSWLSRFLALCLNYAGYFVG